MRAKFTKQSRSLFTLAAAILLVGTAPVMAAPKGPQISRSIARPLIAAQKALQAGKFADGLKNLQTAEGTKGLTPFDHKTIDDLKAYAYIKLNNMSGAQAAWEAALATGACSPADTLRFTRAIFQLSYNAKQYPKAIEYGKKLADLGQASPDIYAVIGQSYYLTNSCKNADVYMDKAIAAARKAGKAPEEGYYQIKLRCAFDAKDTAGEIAGYSDLVRLTNKADYWNALLRIERQDEKQDKNLLMIYRIMYNTNSMKVGSDYVEMAQLLGDAALPGEATDVLKKAIASGVIAPDQMARTNRLLADMQKRADADHRGQAEFAKEAAKSGAGQLYVKLGEVYYGFGDYASAVTAIETGLKKGGVKSVGEAHVYLGLANQQIKNIPAAKKAFAGLKNDTSMPPNIQKLWALYAGTLSST